MGLGKTLTMLSAILCSKQLKQSYDMSGTNSLNNDRQQLNSTLIVLPSRRMSVLSAWEDFANKTQELLDVWKIEIDRWVHVEEAIWTKATD